MAENVNKTPKNVNKTGENVNKTSFHGFTGAGFRFFA
jgi:hypothetical protein